MILDAYNKYTLDGGDDIVSLAKSTNVIDHGIGSDLGNGEPMVVMIVVDVALDDGDADETYVVGLQTDDNAAMSSATLIDSVTMTRGAAVGTKYFIDIPKNGTLEQYSNLLYTDGGTSPAGEISAYLVPKSFVQADKYYADGFTIS